MCAVAYRSSFAASCTVPAFVRAKGEIRAAFAPIGTRTGLTDLYQSGGLRLLCPKVGSGCEAVLINTGGGIAGGDAHRLAVAAASGAQVTLTTQSAERIYRSQGRAAEIDVALSLESGAAFAWLPQETILFDGADLRRRFDVDMVGDARLIALETYVFGRLAMGETRLSGRLHDRWRVHRHEKLIFAEDLRLEGDLSDILAETACGNGARAAATLLYVADDAEARLVSLRDRFAAQDCECGASAWNCILVMRFLSPSPQRLRSSVAALLHILRGAPPPRVWQ